MIRPEVKLQRDTASDAAIAADPYDLSVENISFIIRRKAVAGWTIRDLIYPLTHTLVWASSGRARFTCAGREIVVGPGQMLFFPAGTRRSAQSDAREPWSFESIGFSLHPTREAAAAAALLAALPNILMPPQDAGVAASVHELDRQWHAHLPGSHLRYRGIVSHLLGIYVQAALHPPRGGARRPAMDGVIDLLRRDHRRWYAVEELSARAKLSPSRFRVLFRRATGSSVIRYQNAARVRRAAGLLRSGEHTVTEVADLLGYSDVYYFSRQFKQFTGSPPSSYLTR